MKTADKLLSFEFEFIDELPNTISFEYDDNAQEEIEIVWENGTPVLYANSQAFFVLAKTSIEMAMCDYREGFHLHLKKRF